MLLFTLTVERQCTFSSLMNFNIVSDTKIKFRQCSQHLNWSRKGINVTENRRRILSAWQYLHSWENSVRNGVSLVLVNTAPVAVNWTAGSSALSSCFSLDLSCRHGTPDSDQLPAARLQPISNPAPSVLWESAPLLLPNSQTWAPVVKLFTALFLGYWHSRSVQGLGKWFLVFELHSDQKCLNFLSKILFGMALECKVHI